MTYQIMSKPGSDAKTIKGEKVGYLTGIVYLAPHTLGGINLCKFATEGCKALCLYTAGRGIMQNVQEARLRKTMWWRTDPEGFKAALCEDIRTLVRQAASEGKTPCVRLNGTSDILWENEGIMEQFPNVQFYDYTKYPRKLRSTLPANYHLTYSISEHPKSKEWAQEWLEAGYNSAAVFHVNGTGLPAEFLGRPVINGDDSDLRFLDGRGVIVGLKAKGKAVKSDSKFIQN